METLARRALDAAQMRGATYADVRVATIHSEAIRTKNGRPDLVRREERTGAGVRVISEGAWGFAATTELTSGAIEHAAQEAVELAHAAARWKREDVVLAPSEPAVASWVTPVETDPFDVSLEEKLKVLLAADAAMARVRGVRTREGSMRFWRIEQHFASTEGHAIDQRVVHSGAGVTATATAPGEAQTCSWPSGHGGQFMARGYELVEELGLADHAEATAEEAVALLSAKPCPAGETTLIIGGSQVALQVHESCGHPTELDRALGTEANFAGTSFMTPDQLGRLQYGSELVTIVADATQEGSPGGLGTFGFDDEGVHAQRADLVRKGRFVGYLTGREYAAELGLASMGAMRADGPLRLPLVRMTNINLLPGETPLEEMIAETDEGVLMATNRSWSIDDRRLNFQFGCEAAWEIKNGKRGALLKNPVYTGITPQFWGSCDAIGPAGEWTLWGVPNCGKGQPMQTARVGHGAAPARFRDVQVGSAGA